MRKLSGRSPKRHKNDDRRVRGERLKNMKNKLFKLATKLTTAAMVVSMMSSVLPASAAQLTGVKDVMTRLKATTASSHTISFTSSSPLDASETITIDLSAVTDVGGPFALADIDVDRGDALTLVAACAADNTVRAVENADVITLTNCGVTQIAAGAWVVELGLVAGGLDAHFPNRTAGQKTISIGGTFGDTGSVQLSLVDSDQVTVTATVDASFTFDLDTAAAHGDSDQPYSVALGTVTTTDTRVSGTTDTVNYIFVDLDSNATGGTSVTVLSQYAELQSQSTAGDNIDNTAAAVTDGVENYGICVVSVGQTTGTLSKGASYSGLTCVADTEANTVAALSTTTPDEILTASAPIAGGTAQIAVQAAISVVTDAHNDYQDVLTFIATGTF